MRLLAVLAVGVFTGAGIGAPVPKALKKSPPPLDGTWELVEWHSNGARMELSDEVRWTIEGETLTVKGKKQETPVGFVANATRSVKRPEGGADNAIDYTISPTDGTSPSFRPAVFELGGDTFKICLSSVHNGPRPTECQPSNGVMYVLKRVTDEKKGK